MKHQIIVNKPGFSVVERRRQFTTGDGSNFKLIPLWWSEFLNSPDYEKLNALSKKQPGKVTGGVILGIDYGSPDSAEFSYGIGVEVPRSIPSSLFAKTDIPPANWAIFDCAIDQIQETYKYIFNEWFPSSGYKLDKVPHIEVYLPPAPDEKMKCELWIPVV